MILLSIFLSTYSFVGGNVFDEFLSYAHDISYGVIVKSIEICIDAFDKYFVDTWIRLPTTREALAEAAEFNILSNFPPLMWGALGRNQLQVTVTVRVTVNC